MQDEKKIQGDTIINNSSVGKKVSCKQPITNRNEVILIVDFEEESSVNEFRDKTKEYFIDNDKIGDGEYFSDSNKENNNEHYDVVTESKSFISRHYGQV